MRSFAQIILLLSLGVNVGCGKKAAPTSPSVEQPAPVSADPAAKRNKLLTDLRSPKQEVRRPSIDEISWLAENDPDVLPALVELLKDKGNAGTGRTLANQVNSTREAAMLAIMQCRDGDRVMKEKGLPALREGLSDPSAALREHTAYTIGQLGPIASPLAGDVQKLCTDPDANVRGAAFDALRQIGVANAVELAKLLMHKDAEVARLAAELIPLTPKIPEDAVAPLTESLASENANIRSSAAEGLATIGPKAAPAVQQLADTIKKNYPAEYDPKTQSNGAEASCWKALTRIGEAAVAPTAKLLDHTNALVRAQAAYTLGEIGAPAKIAKDALTKTLGDTNVAVCVEAAITLCKLGESVQDSLDLMKRGINTPDGSVASTAIQGIPRMGARGKELIPLALSKMSDANQQTRYAVVWLVGQLPRDEGAKSAADLAKLTTDDAAEIRRLVGRVLEKLGPAAAVAAESLGKALAAEKELDIREQFVESLIAMGEEAKPALPELLPQVSNSSLSYALRAKVIAAVVTVDPASPEVAAVLVKVANDKDEVIRAAAANALGKLKLDPLPPDALAALTELAKKDSKMSVRGAAIQAIATAGPRAKAAKPDLEAIASGQLPALVLWAKVALAAIDGDVNTAAATIRTTLTDRNSYARAAATEALLIIGPNDADLPVLLKLLKDTNPSARTAAANAISRLGASAKAAVSPLMRLLDEREYETRIAAARALGQIGPAALPAVAKLRQLRSDPLVRATAERALDRIEKKD